jgi:DinB family protein
VNATAYAGLQLQQAFALLNAVAKGLDDAQYNWGPAGTCNTIAMTHVHALTSLDFFLNGVLQGKPTIWQPFAAEHALPANPLEIWGYHDDLALPAIGGYGAEVQKSSLAYVASLVDSDFDREVDTRRFGTRSIAFVLQLADVHTAGHTGEMAAVKGMQGLKGLPF